MVNIDPYQLLIDKLQSLVDRATPMVIPKPFFLTLFEYVEIYDKDERLGPVIKVFNQLKADDTKKAEELGELAIKEMRKSFFALQRLTTAYKTKNNRYFQEAIQHFEAYERNDGSISSSAGPIAGRHGCILHGLMSLPTSDPQFKDFVSQFGEMDDQGHIVRWTFAPSYYLWGDEIKYLERLQPTKVWHSWDKLVSFYGLFKDYEKLRDDKLKKKEFFEAIGLNMLFQELNDIMDYKQDTKRYLREFDVGEYKVHLQRIFNNTKDILLSRQQSPALASKSKFVYDPISGILSIDNKAIKFKPSSFRANLLSVLCKNDKNMHKVWSWDELYEEIEGSSDTGKTEKHKVYDASKRITEYIASKSGAMGFLSYDTNTVRINPSYLA